MPHPPGFAPAFQALPLLLAVSLASTAAMAEVTCVDVPMDVQGASHEELLMACSAAATAIRRLGRCGLGVHEPLQVSFEPKVRHPFGGPVFALFEGEQRRIRITQFTAIPALAARTPFAKLPLRDLYRSLIVHEVVHGVLRQSAAGQSMDQVVSEYLAYGLQIATLPPTARDTFLSLVLLTAQTGDLVFSDVMLALNPYFFAASSYRHLEASGDECRQIHAVIKGSATFIASSRDLM